MDDTSPFGAAAAAVVAASYHLLLFYTCDTCDIWRARSLLGRASCPSSSAKARGSRGVMLWVSRSLVGHDNTLTRRRSCRVYMGADIGAFASPATTPPLFFLFFFSSFLFSLFRDCASRAKSLPSLVSIRRTDARRTQTLTRDQGNGIRDLALFPFLRTLSSFYVRFMRYVSVLYLTLTSFRFRDERRQRGARVTRTPSAVEEPPSRSRALFHPSSSFHYLILLPSLATHIHSYPLISPLIHIPLLCSFHLPSRRVLRAARADPHHTDL